MKGDRTDLQSNQPLIAIGLQTVQKFQQGKVSIAGKLMMLEIAMHVEPGRDGETGSKIAQVNVPQATSEHLIGFQEVIRE